MTQGPPETSEEPKSLIPEKYADAADRLQTALRYNPQLDPKRVFLLADALMNLAKAEQAVAVLQKQARQGPLPPFGRFLLGSAYLEVKQYEKAREQFTATQTVPPFAANSHYGLVRAFSGLGRTEEAAKHREEYVKLKSQELAQTERSRVELRERDLADPRPLASDCYVNAGKLYAAHAAPQQTESLWAKAYALNPENPQLRKLLELLHGQRGPARVGAADFAGDRVGGPGK